MDELSENAQEAVSAVGSSVEAAGVQEQMIEQVSESFEQLSGNVNELTNVLMVSRRLEKYM